MNFNTRKLKEVRIYCECYEQGLYLLKYISKNKIVSKLSHKVIYTKPGNFSLYCLDSIISQLLSHKSFDGIISIVDDDDTEHPLVTIEFSTAVPTDDHIMQRFDFIYWSTFYKVPCLKISPTKMDNIHFGGGTKIKIHHEYYTTLNMEGIYYHVDWPLIDKSDLVLTDCEKVSCPPYLKKLDIILNEMLNSYFYSNNDMEYFNVEKEKYNNYVYTNFVDDKLDFFNSSRLNFDEKGNLTIKFNRFGHGMDPERGMLIFLNKRFLVKPIIKFVVQRESREKYKSLYQGNNESSIMKIIDSEILSNNNVVTFDIAFTLFKKATNTNFLFEHAKIIDNKIFINDNDLLDCLNKNSSVINTLLHFGEKIILCDLNNNVIVEITWNLKLVNDFYLLKRNESLSISKKKLPINILTSKNINEDVVTFSCVKLFLMNGMKNIAVSYPGAQGDRKILQGNGVKTKRDYVDIISIQKVYDNEYNVFLQENKQKISQTQKFDIDKLVSIRNDKEKRQELNELISKIYAPINVKRCYIGVGGQKSFLNQGEMRFDYLMYIAINEKGNIEWQILSSNVKIFEIFKKIININNSLNGVIKLDYPMYIVE